MGWNEFNQSDPLSRIGTSPDPFHTHGMSQHDEEGHLQMMAGRFLNDEQLAKISMAMIVLIQSFNISGVVSNALSIAVFHTLGFSETSNISLMALAVCDLTACILSLWSSLCFTPGFSESRLPINGPGVALLTGAGLWTFLIRCVAWITALISLERCLCILIPLHVKRIVTPRSTLTAIVVIAIATVGPSIGIYWRWEFVWRFSPLLNATILDVAPVNTPGMVLLEEVVNIVCGVVQPLLAFAIVLVCTAFLVVHLRRSSAWRRSLTSAKAQGGHNSGQTSKGGDNQAPSAVAKANKNSGREERVVRMVATIASVFIACFTPSAVLILISTVFKQFNGLGRYRRIYHVIFMLSSMGESVSASVNIVIYYNMASKYRMTLRRLLRLDENERK